MADINKLEVVVAAKDEITLDLNKIESSVIRFVGAISAAFVAIKLTTAPIQAAADFQTALINVKKTTDFGAEGIKQLSADLLDLSKQVNVSAVDLAKIAALGGQLGLGDQGEKSLVAFTDTVARFSSVLEVSVDEAASSIGKLTNIFRVSVNEAERFSAILNEVSNKSNANGAELIDIAKRIGDAGIGLKFEQTVGLAATGVDLGLTLETIGTSFTKFFLDMQTKAGAFGDLLNISSTKWISNLKENGVEALISVLDRLRELDQVSRAQQIEKLFGGGRQAGLANKLINDAQNEVLRKNVNIATVEGTKGTSSLIEQQNVLQGFQAQVTILGNQFTALGIAIGDKALKPLTRFTKSLQEFVGSAGVKDFFLGFTEAIGQLGSGLSSFASLLPGINVNLTNLVKIVQLYLGLKFTEFIVGLIGKLDIFGRSVALVARVQSAFNAAISSSPIEVVKNGYDKLKDSLFGLTAQSKLAKEAQDALIASSAAQVKAAAAIRTFKASTANTPDAEPLAQKAVQAQVLANSRPNNIRFKDSAIDAKERAAREIEVQLEKKLHDDLRQIKVNSAKTIAAQVAAIESTSAADKRKQASAIKAAEKTAQEALYLQARAAAASDLAARRAELTQRVALEVAASEAAILASGASTASKVGRSAEVIKGVLRTFAAGVSLIVRGLFAITNLALFGTIIISVLEMFGLLKPLTDAFFKLGEAVGLVNREQDRLNRAFREAALKKAEEDTKKRAVVEERSNKIALQGLDKGSTKETRNANIANVIQSGKTADRDSFSKQAQSIFSEAASSIEAVVAKGDLLKDLTVAAKVSGDAVGRLVKEIKDADTKLESLNATAKKLKEAPPSLLSEGGDNADIAALSRVQAQIKILTAQKERATKERDVALRTQKATSKDAVEAEVAGQGRLIQDKSEQLERAAKLLDSKTADIVAGPLDKLKQAEAVVTALNKSIAEAQTKVNLETNNTDEKDKAEALLEKQNVTLLEANKNVGKLREAYASLIAPLSDAQNIVLQSVAALPTEQLVKFAATVRELKALEKIDGKSRITGELLPAKVANNSDEDKERFLTQQGLDRAILDAERKRTNLEIAANKQRAARLLEIDKRRLEQGETDEFSSLQKRAAVRRHQLELDIKELNSALAAAQEVAAKQNSLPIDRINAEKDVDALKAQLRAKRTETAQIPLDLSFDIKDAAKRASDEFLSLENRLLESQGRFAAVARSRLEQEFLLPEKILKERIKASDKTLGNPLSTESEKGAASIIRQQSTQELEIIVNVKGVEQARATLQELTDKVSALDELLSTQENKVNLDVSLGILSTLQAQEQLTQARRDYGDALAQLIPQQERLVAAEKEGTAGYARAIAGLEAFKTKVNELKNAVSDLARELNQGLKNAAEGALESILNRTKSAKDALRDAFGEISKQVLKANIKQFVEVSFGKFAGDTPGSFGDIISKALGVGKKDVPRGNSEANALYVQVTNGVLNKGVDATSSATGEFQAGAFNPEQVKTIVDGISSGSLLVADTIRNEVGAPLRGLFSDLRAVAGIGPNKQDASISKKDRESIDELRRNNSTFNPATGGAPLISADRLSTTAKIGVFPVGGKLDRTQVIQAANAAGVDPAVALALWAQESGSSSNGSLAGPDNGKGRGPAIGPFQILQATFDKTVANHPEQFKGKTPDIRNPQDNAEVSLTHLRELDEKLKDANKSLAAYHAGLGAVTKEIDKGNASGIPNIKDAAGKSTVDYVANVNKTTASLTVFQAKIDSLSVPATGGSFSKNSGAAAFDTLDQSIKGFDRSVIDASKDFSANTQALNFNTAAKDKVPAQVTPSISRTTSSLPQTIAPTVEVTPLKDNTQSIENNKTEVNSWTQVIDESRTAIEGAVAPLNIFSNEIVSTTEALKQSFTSSIKSVAENPQQITTQPAALPKDVKVTVTALPADTVPSATSNTFTSATQTSEVITSTVRELETEVRPAIQAFADNVDKITTDLVAKVVPVQNAQTITTDTKTETNIVDQQVNNFNSTVNTTSLAVSSFGSAVATTRVAAEALVAPINALKDKIISVVETTVNAPREQNTVVNQTTNLGSVNSTLQTFQTEIIDQTTIIQSWGQLIVNNTTLFQTLNNVINQFAATVTQSISSISSAVQVLLAKVGVSPAAQSAPIFQAPPLGQEGQAQRAQVAIAPILQSNAEKRGQVKDTPVYTQETAPINVGVSAGATVAAPVSGRTNLTQLDGSPTLLKEATGTIAENKKQIDVWANAIDQSRAAIQSTVAPLQDFTRNIVETANTTNQTLINEVNTFVASEKQVAEALPVVPSQGQGLKTVDARPAQAVLQSSGLPQPLNQSEITVTDFNKSVSVASQELKTELTPAVKTFALDLNKVSENSLIAAPITIHDAPDPVPPLTFALPQAAPTSIVTTSVQTSSATNLVTDQSVTHLGATANETSLSISQMGAAVDQASEAAQALIASFSEVQNNVTQITNQTAQLVPEIPVAPVPVPAINQVTNLTNADNSVVTQLGTTTSNTAISVSQMGVVIDRVSEAAQALVPGFSALQTKVSAAVVPAPQANVLAPDGITATAQAATGSLAQNQIEVNAWVKTIDQSRAAIESTLVPLQSFTQSVADVANRAASAAQGLVTVDLRPAQAAEAANAVKAAQAPQTGTETQPNVVKIAQSQDATGVLATPRSGSASATSPLLDSFIKNLPLIGTFLGVGSGKEGGAGKGALIGSLLSGFLQSVANSSSKKTSTPTRGEASQSGDTAQVAQQTTGFFANIGDLFTSGFSKLKELFTGDEGFGSLFTSIGDIVIKGVKAISSYLGYSFKDGGIVTAYASGGKVFGPGTGTSDSIPAIIDGKHPAAISTGEYIMPAVETKKWLPILELMRRGTFSASQGMQISNISSNYKSNIQHYAGGGLVNPAQVFGGGDNTKAAPTSVQLTLHPDALHMTMSQWLNGELARMHATR